MRAVAAGDPWPEGHSYTRQGLPEILLPAEVSGRAEKGPIGPLRSALFHATRSRAHGRSPLRHTATVPSVTPRTTSFPEPPSRHSADARGHLEGRPQEADARPQDQGQRGPRPRSRGRHSPAGFLQLTTALAANRGCPEFLIFPPSRSYAISYLNPNEVLCLCDTRPWVSVY